MSRYQRRDAGRREDSEIQEIVTRINGLSNFSDLPTKDFAKEGGYADLLARKWRNSLKTSQLRKFFAAIKDLAKEDSWPSIEDRFHLLLPQMAYAKGRDLIPGGFLTIMKSCMKKVDVGADDEKRVENYKTMVKFVESIVAYHKYYNPRA